MKNKLSVGCHVGAAGGIWNAPKNAADLGCEVFQIFTRPPQGGKAPELTPEIIAHFKAEMKKYFGRGFPSAAEGNPLFVVHAPYFINFGSSNSRIYHGSVSVVRQELERSSSIGAKYLMAHLGSGKDLGIKKAIKQTQEGLKKVLDGYKGKTQFLIEIAAGAGNIIGDTFEELAEIMDPLKKYKTFGGICFDTQHAFASGYDLRDEGAVSSTFTKFDKIIGLKWLKMSHINDSKSDLGSHKDQHTHIGEGKIGMEGFEVILSFLSNLSRPAVGGTPSPSLGEGDKVAFGALALILETKPDKVKADIKLLKTIRNKIYDKKIP